MSKTHNLCPPKWKSQPLYIFLMEAFPEHHTPYNRLDVNRLATDVSKSYESLYRKLRDNRLNVEWAKLLCEFANDEERLVASATSHATATGLPDLSEAVRKRFAGRRKPLTIEQDFMRFFI